jgi:hypothetical protein
MLLERVSDFQFDPKTSVVDTRISRLGPKIDKPSVSPGARRCATSATACVRRGRFLKSTSLRLALTFAYCLSILSSRLAPPPI